MNAPAARRGNWCQTFTGRMSWPCDPSTEDVCIEDIAHSLALQCRFAGHCRVFYSVAEHCVRVSWITREPLPGLMHDGQESYLVDVPRPVKPHLRGYDELEYDFMRVIEAWSGLDSGACSSPDVKHADAVLLTTEARDLMAPPPAPWEQRAEPLAETIRPWGWRQAEVRFLARYHELRGERSWRRRAIRANPALVWGFLAWFWHALVWGRRSSTTPR
jgi:hypothetical protein